MALLVQVTDANAMYVWGYGTLPLTQTSSQKPVLDVAFNIKISICREFDIQMDPR